MLKIAEAYLHRGGSYNLPSIFQKQLRTVYSMLKYL